MWQYITLMKRIYLIDCPGVVYDEGDDEAQIVMKVRPHLSVCVSGRGWMFCVLFGLISLSFPLSPHTPPLSTPPS